MLARKSMLVPIQETRSKASCLLDARSELQNVPVSALVLGRSMEFDKKRARAATQHKKDALRHLRRTEPTRCTKRMPCKAQGNGKTKAKHYIGCKSISFSPLQMYPKPYSKPPVPSRKVI